MSPSDAIEISASTITKKTPLVSVHMLTYKHTPYLAQAIEGVIRQMVDFPLELIISDDDSSDGTLDIAKKYQAEHPDKIRVISRPKNIGMVQNFWDTIAACRGAYIAFCEGDDYWISPNKLSKQINFLEKNPSFSLSSHAALLIDAPSGKTIGTQRAAYRSRTLLTEEIILGDGGLLPSASIVIRADTVATPPAWVHEAPIGDYAIALLSCLTGKIGYFNEPLCAYRVNALNSWSSLRSKDISQRISHAEQIEKMLKNFDENSNNRFSKQTNAILSKYFSEGIILSKGSTSAKKKFLQAAQGRLSIIDKIFCQMAVRCRLPVAPIKIATRKVKNLTRILLNDIHVNK